MISDTAWTPMSLLAAGARQGQGQPGCVLSWLQAWAHGLTSWALSANEATLSPRGIIVSVVLNNWPWKSFQIVMILSPCVRMPPCQVQVISAPELTLCNEKARVQILALPLVSCVTLGK